MKTKNKAAKAKTTLPVIKAVGEEIVVPAYKNHVYVERRDDKLLSVFFSKEKTKRKNYRRFYIPPNTTVITFTLSGKSSLKINASSRQKTPTEREKPEPLMYEVTAVRT